MTLRLFVEVPLIAESEIGLPAGAARHVQVRRLQPGEPLRLFDGGGSDWPATVLAMGRSEVRVRVGWPQAVATELALPVTLALGMPANERMDTLVEKATELGVAVIQPLLTARSVLRLHGERAERKRAHWQAVAQAACEQCGRARVPRVAPICELAAWLAQLAPQAPQASKLRKLADKQQVQPLSQAPRSPHAPQSLQAPQTSQTPQPPPAAPTNAAELRLVLSLQPDALALPQRVPRGWAAPLLALSGPEGGLAPEEEAAALALGFLPTALGPRVLRADTAPLALLAWCGLVGSENPPAP